MAQLEHIESIEKRLWKAADTLRANSKCSSNEYFMPVMGLIFLRHAFSRYLMVKEEVEANLPTRGGKTRALTKEDFSQKGAIFLKEEAQFDYLVALPDSADRAQAIIDAMESIEEDYSTLKGILPKNEYKELENDVLGKLLKQLNPDELKKISGDVFGRIYEYFLTNFANDDAHDGGEFFTPVSIVSLIANVLEPECGIVLDPACGSGGMFVQSARVVEQHHQNPTEKLTFRGLEKNKITIRLAKMNLAVHGLEGDIQQAITYYQDPHELIGKADYVMANPPFNVDEIDSAKVKKDPRLPFGLPGVNKEKKVSNGNYIWISYFYSYLSEKGRAGFVMSSQASSAGKKEATVRKQLVETGDVEAMIAVRSNFFYTRTVPCELWFFNRAKPEEHKDKVLMIDARNVYRKVTRKINDFSPEQEQNLLAIVWLYRGETERYLELVSGYCQRLLDEAQGCVEGHDEEGNTLTPLLGFANALEALLGAMKPFMDSLSDDAKCIQPRDEYEQAVLVFERDVQAFEASLTEQFAVWEKQERTNGKLKEAVDRLASFSEASRNLVKQTDMLFKLACRLIDTCHKECDASESDLWKARDINRFKKAADEVRQLVVEELKQVRYFHRNAQWLTERFPDAKFCDVEGLVKAVDRAEIEKNDWSLTPGRYVGVAPEEVDEDFDFEEALREIHVELEDLNEEAMKLSVIIKNNFEELGV